MKISTATFEAAKSVATAWQQEIEVSIEAAEKKFHQMMMRMLKDPISKVFLIELLDQSFRSKDHKRVADQLDYLFSKYGDTEFFTHFEQLLVWSFRHLGVYFPDISVPLFINYLRNDISTAVIKGEPRYLTQHLRRRRAEATRVNINLIGESVLGEEEAAERVTKYIAALKNPNIDYLSIKISTIFSQITPLAHEWSVQQISLRLEKIYAAALKYTFVDRNNEVQAKFVNLDMEEYRDVALTVDAFMLTLTKKPFRSLYAGIVLQAYIPDTLDYLKKLAVWAKQRVEKGGAPIKVRLVKGANQEMELTEAALRGWPCVTYLEKAETDAHYKVLMDFLIDPEVAPYIHTGIASHNLFDQALGMLLAREREVEPYYTAEMLEGMSEAAYKILKKEQLEVILYAPIATAETFTNAIAYLVRRFDENTAAKNFLRHSFGLHVGSQTWKELLKSYDASLEALPAIASAPKRRQDRNIEIQGVSAIEEGHFENESDTDFVLPQNRRWAERIREKWKAIGKNGGFDADIVVGGQHLTPPDRVEVIDKSQYGDKAVVGSYRIASPEQMTEAVRIAREDHDGWRALGADERKKILHQVAREVQISRGDLIGIAAAEVGKVFTETDVEVSEAIDFLRFYPYSAERQNMLEGVVGVGKGVGVVVSPWNFPVAIPAGGIAAALAAGNTVILKPASDAVLCAYRLCQCFWEAGVGKNTLQFIAAKGTQAGQHLITDKGVDFVIFTGSEKSAAEILNRRPDLSLAAETGGKDATIVTALSDRDQAVKNVVASAFGNSGQKCSATSLLVLEREVYEDEHFKKTLVDAVSSLEVGSVWEFKNRIGTLANLPSGNLKHALEQLDGGEAWEIEPSWVDNNPYMLRPSVRWGTQSGDFCHMNELFGPVLSVLCADDLDDAIALVNATGYGLTSGLESLDERERNVWKSKLSAGNLYLNRVTTGAIVRRQPFGGMGKSSIGSGKKAGGFNYIAQFMDLTFKGGAAAERLPHPRIQRLEAFAREKGETAIEIEKACETARNFAYWMEKEFMQEHDYSGIRGESNLIRYLPMKTVLLRFDGDDSLYEMICSAIAVKMVGSKLTVSIPKGAVSAPLLAFEKIAAALLDPKDRLVQEDEESMLKTMETAERIRFLHRKRISDAVYKSAAERSLHIASESFIGHGRMELMHYYKEQSISDSYHRYGNLGLHGLKPDGV